MWSGAIDEMLLYLRGHPSRSIVEAIHWYVHKARGILDKDAAHAETDALWHLLYDTMAVALLLPPLKAADERAEYFKLLGLNIRKPVANFPRDWDPQELFLGPKKYLLM